MFVTLLNIRGKAKRVLLKFLCIFVLGGITWLSSQAVASAYAVGEIQVQTSTVDLYPYSYPSVTLSQPTALHKGYYIYARGVQWNGSYFYTDVLKNGQWVTYNFGDVNLYFGPGDNVTAVRFRINGSSGYCRIEYNIQWGMFTYDYYESSTMAANVLSTKTSADNAYSAASTAATYALNAYDAANAAKASADQAAANTTYNGQSAAYWAYLAAQGGVDTTPPMIQKVGGQNGATCTTTGTFYVVVQATDNRTGQLQARVQVDGGAWTGWYNIPQSAIPVTLSTIGAHTITVEVKDVAGNTSQATMTAFRV
ncbi:hypothetical protein SAMN00808754_1534 [Thermanaeromonas toyohensis ToBE]|uniref:Uncharacterized protein n=1 Tax=Thermanaeromonas toyohensis ToBE TaxID=698762 RepID=A0A1W1VTE5_9FIRM|nr:hypothetical protein SAMN00808754_1534 [Thermanaeromonas toyohensis ToBE]